MIRTRRSLLAASAWLAAIPAATRPADVRAQAPRRGGSLSIALEADVTGIDPLHFSSYNDKQVGITVYDTLLEVDPKGGLRPNLAERFEAAPDATAFRLHLRQGVKFHDDTPLDAQAVVAHFRRLMDPKLRYRWASDLAGIASIDATGPLEVSVRMKGPAAHFPAVLADTSGMVVSPAAVQRHGDAYGAHPAGTGPFALKEWRRGAQIVFVRNPGWWKGPVHLDEVVYRPMADTDTRMASLKAGNLDVAMNAPGKDVVEAKASRRFTVLDPGSLGTSFVMLNVDRPDVSDLRVRQAMAHALDRDALNKVVNKGLLKVANTPFGSGLAPHEAVDGYPRHDPARSRRLLAEYGRPVRIRLSTSNAPLSLLTSQAMQQMWKKVGIETEIVPYEQTALIRAANTRDFQAMLYRWQGGVDPDRNVYLFFHSKGSGNRTGLNDPEMDRLLEAGRSTMDPAKRLEAYKGVSAVLARQLPHLFLTYFNNYSLAQPALKGVAAIPDGLIRVGEVWKDR